MPKPVLYYDDVSPPVRSCLVLIKILNIDVAYKYVDLFKGAQFHVDFLKISPMHTVPTLVHDDLILHDSHAILMYLCDTFAKDANEELFPISYKERMRVINRLLFDCSILFRRDSDLMSEIVRKGFANIDLQYHERKILETYTIMEQFLEDGPNFMAGPSFTIADISLLTTLSTVDLMFPVESGCVEKWPLLHDWFERMKSMPEYQVNAEGLEKLKTAIENFGKFKFSTAKTTVSFDIVE